ncbi:AraC family ligand binding domain-containing protein [Cohnella silvisoli]|uniref:AraC family ligand binding domain-containing protein n=1 Tax=Cohnella silvisoli TaxID=2873699 RepID=UPI003D7F0E0B
MEIAKGAHSPERFIYDHEFIYIVKGSGRLRIEDREYAMEPGDLLYIRPHKVNEMFVSEGEPMLCFAVHFDYVFLGEAVDFSPYSVYLGRKPEEAALDTSWLKARPDAELIDMDIPERIRPARVHQFFDIFRLLCQQFQESRTDSQIWLKSSMLHLIGLVHQELTTKEGIWIGHSHVDLMLDAIQFMQQKYTQKIDLPTLASRATLSPKYFELAYDRADRRSGRQRRPVLLQQAVQENGRHAPEEICRFIKMVEHERIVSKLYYRTKKYPPFLTRMTGLNADQSLINNRPAR